MKRITAFMLAVLLCCLSPAYAADTNQSGEVTWSVDGTTLTISGDGAIPHYRTYDNNFSNNPIAPWCDMDIEKVIIQEGITHIGNSAFSKMEHLKAVELPSTITEVGPWAFALSPITSITFSGPVHLENNVFDGCNELQSIVFESTVTLSSYSLTGCPSLTAVHLPDGTTDLGWAPFYNGALKAVWIPASVQSGEDIFMSWGSADGTWNYRDLTVYGEAGSFIEGECEKENVTFVPRAEVPSLTFFRNQAEYPTGKFQDISVSQEPTVKTVYELGIMNGQSENRFDPSGSLTVAEAVKMAAMVNNTYNGFNGTFPVQENGTAWYQPYVDYCVALGIMTGTEFTDYDQPATRAQMAYLFANALPEQEVTEISDMPAFPDVTEQTPYCESIEALQKAGIVIGDENGYRPNDMISRLEAAIIISREAVPDMRIA